MLLLLLLITSPDLRFLPVDSMPSAGIGYHWVYDEIVGVKTIDGMNWFESVGGPSLEPDKPPPPPITFWEKFDTIIKTILAILGILFGGSAIKAYDKWKQRKKS